MTTSVPWDELVARANAVRENAWAPYSHYKVGAAVLSAGGRIFVGCNVENASFGLTMCAERGAIAHMVAAGERSLSALAVVTEGPEPGTPCGLCRQAMAEFAIDLPIALAVAGAAAHERVMTSLSELFPKPFRGDLVTK